VYKAGTVEDELCEIETLVQIKNNELENYH
jgi:hypothetical protein